MTILELPFGAQIKEVRYLYQVIRHFCIQILPDESDRSGNQISFMSIINSIFLQVSNKQSFKSFRSRFNMELN